MSPSLTAMKAMLQFTCVQDRTQKSSAVWEHFKLSVDKAKQCAKCNLKLAYRSGTTTMINDLNAVSSGQLFDGVKDQDPTS